MVFSQNDSNGALELNVGVCHISFYLIADE